MNIVTHMPRGSRYTLGSQLEIKFIYLLELSYIAYFCERDKRLEKVNECVLVLDTLKFLISIAWEGKLISHAHYEALSLKLDEAGRMFGGWRKNLEHPDKKNRGL